MQPDHAIHGGVSPNDTPVNPPEGTPAPVKKNASLLPKADTPLLVFDKNGKPVQEIGTILYFVALTDDMLIVRESKYGTTFWIFRTSISAMQEISEEFKKDIEDLAVVLRKEEEKKQLANKSTLARLDRR